MFLELCEFTGFSVNLPKTFKENDITALCYISIIKYRCNPVRSSPVWSGPVRSCPNRSWCPELLSSLPGGPKGGNLCLQEMLERGEETGSAGWGGDRQHSFPRLPCGPGQQRKVWRSQENGPSAKMLLLSWFPALCVFKDFITAVLQ